MSETAAVELVDLSKTYRTRRRRNQALESVNLTIPPGEIFGLLGPNGAGKTTTIRIVAGLLRPTQGAAKVYGICLASQPARARALVGLMPEDAGNHRNLTVAEELAYYGALYGLPRRETLRRSAPLLDRLGLSPSLHQRAKTLSKGTCRKIHLVRALLHQPRVLLLDEPTDGLDPLVANEVWNLLRTLAREQAVTILLCSHHLEEVQQLCQRVAILQRRILVQTPLGRPQHTLYRFEFAGPAEPWLPMLPEPWPANARADGRALTLRLDGEAKTLVPPLVRILAQAGAPILSVGPVSEDLRTLYRRTIDADNGEHA